MPICSICRNEKQCIEQYVIPEVLCGYYYMNTVCETCHENVVASIDRLLISHKLIHYKIEQLKHQMDSPLLLDIYDEEKYTNEETDIDEFQFSNSLIMKLCKRNDISLHDEIWKEERVTKVASSIQRELLLDNRKYKMSLLKMAYLFATQNIDGYINDPDAVVISNILSNIDFIELKDRNIVRDLNKSSLWNTLNTDCENHYFILLSDKDGLFCFIRLFDVFDVVVHLSKKRYDLSSPIVGVNDATNQVFYKKSLKEYMNGLFKPTKGIQS
ncbi:HNH endonuclease [Bacillus cytotoxicus]|uniref:HNH endonuclease n=1 Tax=Bacillus cytotoxicus TaxID=580165 RepID=A0ACC6AAF2_9BACI|nr:HNH endonuclease [Bacillus cytotoxicus]